MDKEKITYQEIKKLCNELIWKILINNYSFTHLVLVTKWALIPWYFLADWLKIRHIQTINIKSYFFEKQTELKDYTTTESKFDKNSKVLIFDDLTDTWDTLNYIRKNYIEKKWKWIDIKTACLFVKERSKFIPDIFVKKVWNEWIEFEYEI